VKFDSNVALSKFKLVVFEQNSSGEKKIQGITEHGTGLEISQRYNIEASLPELVAGGTATAIGNAVTAKEMASAARTDHWYNLSAVDLWLDDSYACIVTLGDSITDGRGSTTNKNNRWPDNLARRLQENPSTAKIGVLNQGIGGNTIVAGGLGPTALKRFDRDVLEPNGVRWLIILEGVNDIGNSRNPGIAEQVIAAYEEFIEKAHAKNIKVYGVPILPFMGSQYRNEAARQTINEWIRTSGKFDAVIDLDEAVRDPDNPSRLLREYDSGDHLHLSVAGLQKMADAIDLDLFE